MHTKFTKMRDGYIWYYFKSQNFSLMVPPKCGTRSMLEQVSNEIIRIKHNQILGDTYAVVRHPLDKFCSLWRSKCRDKINPKDEHLHNMTLTELMDHIEGGAKDIHWTRQTELIGELDPILVPLAMLGFWWKQSGLGELGQFNLTSGNTNISDELKNRILTFYADDVILHKKAELYFCWDTCLKLNPQLKQ